MKIRIQLEGVPLESVEALVAGLPDDALASPWRSTVPLIEYWRQQSSLEALWKSLDVPAPSSAVLAFEHPTPVRAGTGKASFTDLMIISDSLAVAVEAKFTEPRYETVAEWLGPAPTDNRVKVLRGWLQYIHEATGRELSFDEVRRLPYQVVHRTASVCAIARPARAVVYQVYSTPIPGYYEQDLGELFDLLAPAGKLSGWVHGCTVAPSPEYRALMEQWEQGKRALQAEVRDLLSTGRAMSVASASLKCVSE